MGRLPPPAGHSDREAEAADPPSSAWRTAGEMALLLLILTAYFVARVQYRETVLIRDEGELAHAAQRVLDGGVPYRDVYILKTPLVIYFLAAVEYAAGSSLAAIRVATSVYGLATACVLYAFMRRSFGRAAGLFAALAFALLTLNECTVVHSASAEFFVLFWMAAAAGAWFYAPRRDNRWLLLAAGIAAGLAYQCKQSGSVVLIFLLAEIAWRKLFGPADQPVRWARVVEQAALATIGFGSVTVATLLFFASQGALAQYLECTWTSIGSYVGGRSLDPASIASRFSVILRDSIQQDVWLWVLGVIGASIPIFRRRDRSAHGLWLLLAGSAGMAILAGQSYRQYFDLLFVPLAIGCGMAAGWLWRAAFDPRAGALRRAICAVLLVLPWIGPVDRAIRLVSLPADEKAVLLRGQRPFDTSPRVAAYLADRIAPDDCLMILGSEPQIYFYAERRNCSRLVLTYPLTGPYDYAAALQQEFIDDLALHRPPYLLLVNMQSSWGEFPELTRQFLARLAPVLNELYRLESYFPPASGDPAQPSGDAAAVFHIWRRKPRSARTAATAAKPSVAARCRTRTSRPPRSRV
jgi:hypothetical protein